jgi:hypothetical protein
LVRFQHDHFLSYCFFILIYFLISIECFDSIKIVWYVMIGGCVSFSNLGEKVGLELLKTSFYF